MAKITFTTYLLLLNLFLVFSSYDKTIEVSNQEEFKEAQLSAVANDIISWLPGTYKDIYLNIFKDNITVQAKELGKTLFTGASKAYISGDGVTLKGFHFIDGDAGSSDVVMLAGDHIKILELNILRYAGQKYLYMKRNCQYNLVSKCNFETRTNNIDKNILAIGVSDKQAGFHKIEFCSFKNFEGTGGDMGVEPIRIGSSSRALFDSKTIVEYCYFTKCNGDGELISTKSCKNIFRYNTFEDNPLAELVLRHGNDNVVYGNFFIKGKGGVRIREGSNHYVFNNYFTELTKRSITLNSGKQNPIKNIYIMHNTFVNTAKLHLGGNKTVLPKKVVLENNLFAYPNMSANFGNATGKEEWLGNLYQGDLGMPKVKGLTKIEPLIVKNEFGLFELEKSSAMVNGAVKSKIKLPEYEGLELDSMLSLDAVKNKRPDTPTHKDVGCFELTTNSKVLKPFVTIKNTGPSYNTDIEKLPQENEVEIQESLVVDIVKDNKNEIKNPEVEYSPVEQLNKQITQVQD